MRSAGIKAGITGLALGLTLLVGATQATAREQAGGALPRASAGATPVGTARPILAWTEFCKSYAAECAVDTNEPTRITLTPSVWSLVTSVNRRVNDRIQARTDQEHWGVPDRWDLAEDGVGDCEDYQLLKRRLLAEAGLPRRAMRMTVVIDEKGEGHAVLTLITDRGDFALDNKTSTVMAWYETGYTYIKRESQDAVAWVSLGGATSPMVTANR
ncbi:transglutaminase-like cysteine peptidase [Methylobacterium brachythecii]|uniref:Transglutaminase n=1 Tax=Methylobacterium brachythecii TaxID=1176177 RepID=A0A7W6ANL2_9HYPH|nr:transglutaminase-like cysteine peptidase [Methylobacterium brachythecii]MBB3902957.1 putative transglutaminase-like cysteine proteinase [Methylobacterium brachythecii]GLS46340.1 transglutaminase [Methylobacterium brachythecii]